jgi:hypothetical protein
VLRGVLRRCEFEGAAEGASRHWGYVKLRVNVRGGGYEGRKKRKLPIAEVKQIFER